MDFNKQISNVEPSKSVTLLTKTKELQKTDPEILNLTGGEPDFPTPKAICDTVVAELAAGHTHYSDSRGDAQLRARIARKLQEENHAPFQPENILITPGAKYSVYLTIRALINPGDEAIWLTPGWVSYPSIVEASGVIPVAVHLKYEENYRITVEALEAAVSDKTKLLIINYPNNPTGQILTEADIQALTVFLRKHPDIYILSDEIYEKIIYDQKQIISLASIPEFFDRVVIVNGFSKCSAMTGWRLGYLACNPAMYQVVLKLFQHSISCTSSFLQKGALTAMDCVEETEQMRQAYEKRKNLLVKGIREIPGVELLTPAGAFYAWVKFDTDMDSETLCNDLLDKAKIAGVPGIAYGEEDCVCIRFSFAASEDVLKTMLERLKNYQTTHHA